MTLTSAVDAAYIVAALLLLGALAGLSRHESARRGNLLGIGGMALALVATVVLAVSTAERGALTTLLLIAAGAVALLLGLIIGLKLHAFVSLVLVSVVTALAVGFDPAEIPDVLIYGFAGVLLLFVGIGFIVLPVLGVLWLVFVVLATIKASNGYDYRYPLTIRFVS